ncbi:hypothetical protein L1049_014938 [Liquidambar formosana]|uniref:RING-type domain-containing protein n=1 Tax=Liquidambar formosana TaxID=63359 RepID=A0AAP0X643_LIQFO
MRFLADVNSPSSAAEPPSTVNVESDYVIILAALLCALICTGGLVVVARCAWIRRLLRGRVVLSRFTTYPLPPPPPSRGLKKKILRSLPTLTFNAAVNGKLADCPICLAEFVNGDGVRVLPQCGHMFHVSCVDTWLGCHSSCPSCRQILVVARCQKCGGFPTTSHPTGVQTETDPEREVGLKTSEDVVNGFLP